MTIKSQRLVTFVLLVLVGVLLAFTGGRIVIVPDDLTATLVSLAAPFTLIFVNLNSLFSVLDARIAEGKLEAGDLLGMFSMKEWWLSFVANVAGLVQVFGLKVISPDEQAIFVTFALAAVTVLLRSFTSREPTDNWTTFENVIALEDSGGKPTSATDLKAAAAASPYVKSSTPGGRDLSSG